MDLSERQEPGAAELVAAHPEIAEAAAGHVLENPECFSPDVVEMAKGRGRKKKENSAEIMAVAKMAEDVRAAEELYGDGRPYDVERLEEQIRFFRDQAGNALLEMGKCFIRIKAHEEHGRFLRAIESVDLTPRSAQYAMAAARKFSNAKSVSHLGPTKLIALTVLDDDEVEVLKHGGTVRGVKVDDIDRMSNGELRAALRKAKEEEEKLKEARKNDRAAFERSLNQKDEKLNRLDMEAAGRSPPTREERAAAALDAMAREYTQAIGAAIIAVREAHALVARAERVEGVEAAQLESWLGRFSPDMQAFHDILQTWTGELDDPRPAAEWTLAGIDAAELDKAPEAEG